MCGIAGVVYADRQRRPDPFVLRSMAAQLSHRGPDGEGFWIQPGIGLLHRRLSIIDLATGAQPMGNEDGSVQIAFNGEIYNFGELRQWLDTKGHRFRTQSDTETIVHLYEEMGEDVVSRLRGMFAFAIWDDSRRRLLLARDRLGIKPLYMYRDAEKVVFASEPKAILAHPGIYADVDVTALDDYLAFGTTIGTRSIFRGIEKLPAAHTLTISAGQMTQAPRRYWQLQFSAADDVSVESWIDRIRDKVSESVRGHLIADVPIGAFLSGGLDSSIVTTTAAAHHPALRTFSVGFDDQASSELPYARLIAAQCGTSHTEEVVTTDAVSLLDQLSFYYDEPFADSSAVPSFLVSKVAASQVKVVLSGDGGDEAFGGYARYKHDLAEARLRAALPRWFARGVIAPLAVRWPKSDWLPRPLRAKTALTNLSRPAGSAYANTMMLCRNPIRHTLLAPDLRSLVANGDPGAALRLAYDSAPSGDALAGMISADVGVTLPDDYLVKVDRASMAHGVEVRPPLLDHELLELTAQIPSRFKIARGETKWLLKRAYADMLPPELLKRPKQGFEMPVERWMRGPLKPLFEEVVLPRNAVVGTLIDQSTAQALMRDHARGVGNHGQVLWSLLVLAKWAERYMGSPAIPGRRGGTNLPSAAGA